MAYDNLQELPTPNTNPAGPGFVSLTLTDNTPGMIHPLNNGGSISVKFSGNYWTISISYPQLTITEGSTIIPFLYSLQGSFTNFYMQMPQYVNPLAGYWAVVPPNGDVSMGDLSNQVKVANWADNISNAGSTLSVGDMIKFTNSRKIYMITATDLSADVMTLTLSTDVVDPVAMAAATLEPNNIKFRVRVQNKLPSITLNADGLYESFSLELRENIL